MLCLKHGARRRPNISLSNVVPNERFRHSIILIRGEILNYNHRHGPTTIQITNANDDSSSRTTLAEIRADGKFSVAFELARGVNLLKFQYCCTTTELPLIFEAHENPKYLLKVLYIICKNHDGHFQAPRDSDNSVRAACGKIDLVIRIVQCLYADMLAKHGFDKKTFAFVDCQPFYSDLTVQEARKWNQFDLWKYHAKEILAHASRSEGKQQENYKYFGILASTLCENGIITGNAALGIGDVALFGSGTLYAWPRHFAAVEMCLRDDTVVDRNQLMDDSNGRRTFGGCFATALGSMCHEIGHIFDLGHTVDGIMGCDIDYVQRMFIIEKYPRDLPRRFMKNCSPMQSEGCTPPDEPIERRLTTVKKQNLILSKYHSRRSDELTFLSGNCAILLNYHKWFNQPDASIESDIRFEFERKTIVSSIPLAFVEFRTAADGMCMKFYRFDVSNEYQFTIAANDAHTDDNCDLIAIDKSGNVLRLNAIELAGPV